MLWYHDYEVRDMWRTNCVKICASDFEEKEKKGKDYRVLKKVVCACMPQAL